MKSVFILCLTALLSISPAAAVSQTTTGNIAISVDVNNPDTTQDPNSLPVTEKSILNIFNSIANRRSLPLRELGDILGNRVIHVSEQNHTSMTCSNLVPLQPKFLRVSMDSVLDAVKAAIPNFNPDAESNNTEVCRIHQKTFDKSNPKPSNGFINIENVQFNFFVFVGIFLALILTEFTLTNYGLRIMRKGKNIMDCTISRVFYSRLGPTGHHEAEQVLQEEKKQVYSSWCLKLVNRVLINDLRRQSGEEECRLVSFEYALIIILLIISTVSLSEEEGLELSMIGNAVSVLIFFILTVMIFFYHGDKTNIINAWSQEGINQFKTLLVSKLNPSDCDEASLRTYFLDKEGDIVAGVSLIRKVDILESLDEELTLAKEVRELLGRTPREEHPLIKPTFFARPINPVEYYDKKIVQLTNAVKDELLLIPTRPVTSAFVTFTSRSKAMAARNFHQTFKRKMNPCGISVDWAPSVNDIVWSTMHKDGDFLQLILMIFLYSLRIVITLGGPSAVIVIIRSCYPSDHYVVQHVLPYLKSFLTMIFWGLACGVDLISHSKSSSTQMGLFFSSLIIQFISEILMPTLLFTDISDLFAWMGSGVDHSLRLHCLFKKELGTEFAICIIKWSFLQSTFVLARLPHVFTSIKNWYMAPCRAEAELRFKNRSVEFEIGTRYAEIVAQVSMTFIGSFTYPPIVLVSFFCMFVRYLIDSYHSCRTFAPTITGVSIHRWAVLLTMISFVVQLLLILYKNTLMETLKPDYELLWDTLVVIASIGLFIVICLIILSTYFTFSSTQMYCENLGAVEESQHYIPPVISKWTHETMNVPYNSDYTTEEESQDETKLNGLLRILRVIGVIGVVIAIFAAVIVTTLRFEYKIPVHQTRLGSMSVYTDYNYNLTLYSGRVPYNNMVSICPKLNEHLISMNETGGWLDIESECEDRLVDEAVRLHWESVFGNIDAKKRFMWTGGYFNLTTDDQWRWLGHNTTPVYENFCKNINMTETISVAKEHKQNLLYIVKDYRSLNIFEAIKKPSCWKIYHAQDLIDDLRLGTLSDNRPRLAFVCKAGLPTMAERRQLNFILAGDY